VERILRRFVEVHREESKGSEMNWVNGLWFPGITAFNAGRLVVVESKTHPVDEASVIEILHDG